MPDNKITDHSLLDHVLEGVSEGIIVVDSMNRILKYNKAFISIFKYQHQDILNMTLNNLIPEYNYGDFEIIETKIKNSPKRLMIRMKRININCDELKVLYISTFNSLQKELVDQFEETKMYKEMYENILNSIEEGIHCIDINGNIIIYNLAQEKLEGYTSGEVLGKHVTEIYNLDHKSSLLLRVLEEGRPLLDQHQEYSVKNGKYVDVLCSTVPLYSGKKIIGAAAILKDYAKWRQMAERMLDLQEKLSVKWSKTTSVKQKETYITFDHIIGQNRKLQENIKWAKTAAKSDSPILIYGETGTGKELFAQSIHMESNRSQGPFQALNCAAIPENLLEGILFGTAKGAFTGAINRHGLFEQANGGTLFLDEINSMPLALQAKLLRVLEEKKIRRLGENVEIPIDTRIISSCNTSPSVAVRHGQIRSDLFYRLAVVYISIPPLRERLDDLELLCNYFITKLNIQLQKNIRSLEPNLITAFNNYHWPGNVRQLKHTIECAMNIVHDEESQILAKYIPQYLKLFTQNDEVAAAKSEEILENVSKFTAEPASNNLLNQIKMQEREAIKEALIRSKGNIAKAAQELNMSRQLLHYHLKKHGLK
ncbi:MAG: sigma 54-interacting transcriptional regulator [Dehalobacterium sp.]|jgi:arginine utilization regulatory protein